MAEPEDADDTEDIECDEPGFSKYVVVLFYIGFGFCGWQKQAAEPQVQGESSSGKHKYIQASFEDSVSLSVPQCVGVSAMASGRTDAGTHASGQVVHFVVKYPKPSSHIVSRMQWTPTEWTQHCSQLALLLNQHLPREIRVQHLFSFPVHFPPELPYFHARKSAQWKQYSYYIQQGGVYMVDWSPFCLYYKDKLDVGMLKRELSNIKGDHDFQNFVNDSKNLPTKTRFTISSIDISFLNSLHPQFPSDARFSGPCASPDDPPAYASPHSQPVLPANAEPAHVIRIRIVGSGFLRHMVRRVVGSLLWVAAGRAEEGIFARVLNDGIEQDKEVDYEVSNQTFQEADSGNHSTEASDNVAGRETRKSQRKRAKNNKVSFEYS